MKSLRRRQQLLRRRIRDLLTLLRTTKRRPTADLSQEAIHLEGEDLNQVRYEIALAAAQLAELEPVRVAFFGSADEAYPSRRPLIPISARGEIFEGAILYLMVKLVASSGGTSVDELFGALISWREWRSVRSLLERDWNLDGPGDRLESMMQRLRSAWSDLPAETRMEVGDALTAYLANQWMYPWAEIASDQRLGDIYGALFEIARIPNGDPYVFKPNSIHEILKTNNLSGELAEKLWLVMEALDRAISEYGISALEDILADGGRPIPNLPADVGFIPGDGRGPCPRILIGIATTKSARAKFGAVQVMRQLRDALIKCCGASTSSRTEIAIFVGPIETIAGVIDESAGDLEGHLRNGVLKVFIPVGVLRNRMNVLSWR
jgi:hypothetical protein